MNTIPNHIGDGFYAMILTSHNLNTTRCFNNPNITIFDNHYLAFSKNPKVRVCMLVLHEHFTRINMRFFCIQTITKVVRNHAVRFHK